MRPASSFLFIQLSNARAKLQDENYQDKLVWAIHMGVLKYMNGA